MAGLLTSRALPLQPGDPRRLGGYEITGRLGVGEQGAVFAGRSAAGRPVAVKLLHVRLSGEPVARSRFAVALAPARKVAGFCTAGLLDSGVEGDRPYVVAELVDGPSLQQLVAEEGPRGPAVVERVAVGAAIALAAVHRAGALHLDVKPGNVLLGRDGPRVADFGVARALEAVNAVPAGRTVTDPAYQAPEQLSGQGIGPAADVFAWAATLVFAATGAPPFGDDSPSEVMQRIVYDDPDLSALPESLREVVADALAKDPAQRPTAAGLLERLLAEDGPLAARLPASMVDEGRALSGGPAPAAGSPPAQAPALGPAPAPLALPAPDDSGPNTGPQPETSVTPRPDVAPEPEPAPTQAVPVLVHDRIQLPGNQATAVFDMPSDPVDPADPTAPHIVPGMAGPYGGDDARTGTALLDAVPPAGRTPLLARVRRNNHVLGVALSLTIGVLVGVAIIALVLWPQLKEEPAGSADPARPAAGQAVDTIPGSFGGTWKGTAVNATNGVSFPLEVTFTAGGKNARAVYPKERCTGALTFVRGTGESLRMTVAVAKPCSPGNVQVDRQPDGSLKYVWTSPSNDNRRYEAVLKRG
ncbi:serine/threonine-protein kinase [Actinomadura hibisca]|uniref:serine/threonine-protein kinase n=1 Tax=Actinomadura hibisca TaxID=68565 RepID=UPI00083716EA|nr:serine/threonine-protein kinase [Actinomadura hibisca]